VDKISVIVEISFKNLQLVASRILWLHTPRKTTN